MCGKIDFAIITAIEVERSAILKALEITNDNRIRKDNRTYWRKRLPLKNGKFYEIVVAQPLRMGNVSASKLADDVLNHWEPAVLLMVGIAGAAHSNPKQQLGDLVIGSEVCYYEMGKITAEGEHPQPLYKSADATLLDRVQSMLPEPDFEILGKRPGRRQTRPKIDIGVIASGEKVISDKDTRDAIAKSNRKIMAIEMEGYGVSSAAWERYNPVRCLVIRALCDYADASKNDGWHSYAAAVAAGFAKAFLLDEPLEPRNKPE